MAATGVDAKLLRNTKFPADFNQKVDMQRVNLQVMKKWIASRIAEILGDDDDVVIELCFNLIEGSRYPDIKSLQIQLTGFLEKETAPFCKELWKLCLSAQTSPQGVPKELLEAKKMELIQEKLEADKAAEDARRRREEQERRERESVRHDRGARGGDSWRSRRGDRDHASRSYGRGFNRSRSPDPRGQGIGSYRGARRDSYIPGARHGGGWRDHRRRSISRSISPASFAPRSSVSRNPSPRRRRRDSGSPSRRHYSPGPRQARKRSRSPPPSHRESDRFSWHSGPHSHRDTSRSSDGLSRSPPRKRHRYTSSRSVSRTRSRRYSTSRSISRSRSLSRSRSSSRSLSPPRRSGRRSSSQSDRSMSEDSDRSRYRGRGRRGSRSLSRSVSPTVSRKRRRGARRHSDSPR